VYGSLQTTVAHEVFHLVQYAYVPEGFAGWLAESTANWNAYDVIRDNSTALINLATQSDWWLEPWKTVADPSDRSTRAYGANWMWWADDNELTSVFNLLAIIRQVQGAPKFRATQLSVATFALAYYHALDTYWRSLIDTGIYTPYPNSVAARAFQDRSPRLGRLIWHWKCEAFAPITKQFTITLPDGTRKTFRLGIVAFIDTTTDTSHPLHPRNDVILRLEPLSCAVLGIFRDPAKRVKIEWEPIGGFSQMDRDVVVSFLDKRGQSVPVSMNDVPGETIGIWGKGVAVLEPSDDAQFMFVTGGSLTKVPAGIRIRMSSA
jgi:hypothetical protein